MENIIGKSTAFQKIIIIGYGKVTGEVLFYVKERQLDYGYQLSFIEHEIHPFSITAKICTEKDIPFAQIEDKKELAGHLLKIQEKTLIISASNNFLFPKALIEKENITIINFHNALLPSYPGRNAPSWVIFMGEEETGITWHYVTSGVDEGNIIIQKKWEIGTDTKAYELAEKLMDLAYEAFVESFEAILEERAETKEQNFSPDRRMYHSYDVPADGFFEIAQGTEYVYRLLRSVDYGKNDIFPRIQTIVDGQRAEIMRYRKVLKTAGQKTPQADFGRKVDGSDGRPEVSGKEGFLYLPLGEESLLKLKYRML